MEGVIAGDGYDEMTSRQKGEDLTSGKKKVVTECHHLKNRTAG